jgi:Cd2+/Zn2+-exporting ATPase
MTKYRLTGLDCPVCAQRIEDGVRVLEGVAAVSVDFGSLTMRLDASDPARVREAIRGMEPSIVVEELGVAPKAGCASCDDSEAKKAPPAAGLVLFGLPANMTRELLLLGAAGLVAALAFLAGRLPAAGSAGTALAGAARGAAAAWLSPLLYVAAYLLAGRDVLLGAARNIARGRVFDELFLMGIATVGALVIGQYAEAVGVMVFYKIGEAFQESAAAKSRASIRGLLDLRPDKARLRRDKVWTLLPSEEAAVGEAFLVLPGERIPLDGRVVEGESLVDTQALTGEPRPRRAAAGDEILAGTLVLDGALEALSLKPAGESQAARIAELVENASHAKAKSERFISRFARVYTPIVVVAALLLAVLPPLLGLEPLAVSAYRALVLLVISCPCALVISVPLGYFGGIGGAARRGILVKGGTVLDSLAKTRTAVFDKTGTLTKGVFTVSQLEPAPGFTAEGLLELAAAAESRSRHPIAASIREAARARGLADGTEDEASSVKEAPGRGLSALVGARTILVGSERFLREEGFGLPPATGYEERGGTVIHLAVEGVYAGSIRIGDEAKDDAAAAIKALARLGVERTVILTGDSAEAAAPLARELGIGEIHAGLLPGDKLSRLELIIAETTARGGTTLFVGDGINDAPVLARADIGAAMGAGADVAIECADLILMTDEPSRVAEAIERARRTRSIVLQNIMGALAIKAAFLALGALGIAVMWEAVIADVGVALLATLNSTRAIR